MAEPDPPITTKPTRRSGADERRRHIVGVAAELFDGRGYHATTVEDIAEAAGLKKATIYHYFAGKDRILAEIHESFIERLIAQHEARADLPIPPDLQLLEVITDMLEVTATRRGQVRAFFEHFRELPLEEQNHARTRRDHYEQIVRGLIIEAIAAGRMRDVDPRLATLALFGMCNWAYQWLDGSGRRTAREIAYVFWDIFLNSTGALPVPLPASPNSDLKEGQ